MEWSNAKKFVIVLLVLLNVLLAGLNYKQNRENTMTAAQERSIFEVLSRNGITMYTDLLTEHPPMSRLAVELPSYNKETLERLFFGSARTTASTKGGETVYQGKQSSLTMSGARGVWETKAVKSGKGEMTKTEALREAQKFIDNTEHFFGSYGDAIIAEESEGFRVNFFGQYKREKVFANYFSFFVKLVLIFRKEIACAAESYLIYILLYFIGRHAYSVVGNRYCFFLWVNRNVNTEFFVFGQVGFSDRR